MMRIVVDIVFQTWGEAVAAADELRAADYDVLIADDVVDVYSNAAFAEVSTMAGPESADADAFWADVQRIVDPFDGIADNCGPVDDDHVPFENYRQWPSERVPLAWVN